jgi:hypothetical protein
MHVYLAQKDLYTVYYSAYMQVLILAIANVLLLSSFMVIGIEPWYHSVPLHLIYPNR